MSQYNPFSETLTTPATVYTAGGYVMTVTQAQAVTEVLAVTVKPAASTGQGTSLVAQPVSGSEQNAGVAQNFLLKFYSTGATTGGALQELAAGSTLAESLKVEVLYRGIP